jgi:predicted CXXCH cytochrome family protein
MKLGTAVGAVLVFTLAGCTDETIVYRDRDPFNPPPDQTNGFLGYFTAGTKQTTCGNCHVGHQRDWKTSAHADAWAGLQSSGSAQAFCNACHTVSQNGNDTDSPAGFTNVPDEAYHDVQCESCHGPGYDHVVEPDLPGNVPLPRLRVTGVGDDGTCAECHQGTHHPFVEEWSQSRHSHVLAAEAGRVECASCHEARAALATWGYDVKYVERDSTGAASYFPPTTCGLCHDPHGSANSAQLRFPIDVASPDQNLCVRCHLRRIEPAPASSRGAQPHAPQGAIFYGEGGYRNNQVMTTHRDATANPRQCAGCHVVAFEREDPTTGETIFSTGHTFRPIPCLVDGEPVADNSCVYTDTTVRSFKACTGSGCHGSQVIARDLLASGRSTLGALMDQVWQDLNGNQTIDAEPTDAGYLATVKAMQPAEFTYTDATITAAEGAEFNARTVGEGLYDNGDKSLGVHNAFLARALVQANIQELLAVYPFLPAPPVEVQLLMAERLPGATRTNALAGKPVAQR